MKQRIDLNVETRETGKRTSRSLRMNKRVPAVIYGAAQKNTPVSIFVNDILKYNTRAYENALFNLKGEVKEAAGKVVLLKEVKVHPVTRAPQHVDLFAIDLNKTIRIDLEMNFEGKPVGLADGGLLNIVNRTIEIEVLPTAIPENLVVDVSNLGIGDSIHVADLTVPEGVKVLTSGDITVCVVNMFEEEVIAAPTDPAAVPVAGAAPAAGAPAAGKDAKAAAPAAAKAPAKK